MTARPAAADGGLQIRGVQLSAWTVNAYLEEARQQRTGQNVVGGNLGQPVDTGEQRLRRLGY